LKSLVLWLALAEKNVLTDLNFASRTDQTLPVVIAFIFTLRRAEPAGEQHFDPAMKKIARGGVAGTDRLRPQPGTAAKQPGRKHFCIVKNQQVVRPQGPGKIAESAVQQFSGRAIQVQ
jgi:hypothetical protein